MEDIKTIAARMQAKLDKMGGTMPRCSVCGNELDYGGHCQKCLDKKEQDRIEKLTIARLGGLRAYKTYTEELYDNKKMIEMCKGYPQNNLFIFGEPGVGKTHLATAIIRKFANAIVVKSYDIFSECRGDLSVENEMSVIKKYSTIPYLLIDDLGVEKPTEFSISTLYRIIDGRYMNMVNGLIITSNLSADKLAQFLHHDNIVSRIMGMCKVINIKGQDRRIV